MIAPPHQQAKPAAISRYGFRQSVAPLRLCAFALTAFISFASV
jgi:hypothetical protein